MSIRTEKVGALIREELALHLQRSQPDYLDGMVTVTSVKVSPDLSIAKVYVSIWNSKTDPEILMKRLNANQTELRTAVAHRIRLRKMPELRFYRDDTLDTAERIDELIERVRAEDERKRAGREDSVSNANQSSSESEENDDGLPHDSR